MDDATLPPTLPPRSSSPALSTEPQPHPQPETAPETESESDNNKRVAPASSAHDLTTTAPLKEEAAENDGKLEGGKQKRKRTRYAELFY